ncbi:MAG: M56 family metallopeptidase [Bacteroidota bacterium]
MANQLFEAPIVSALGWALLHCLWQGAVIAILLAFLLILMRDFSSRTRYIVIGLCLAFFVATLPANITREYQATSDSRITTYTSVPDLNSDKTNVISVDKGVRNRGWLGLLKIYFQKNAPLIAVVYLMGVLVLVLRFLGQLAYVQRLKVHKVVSFSGQWIKQAEILQARLGIVKKIKYLQSVRIQTPMTIGWMKPVILFPVGLLTRLSQDNVEAILLHELAHIKRSDYLFNVFQSLAVILFFFHPAVYWMSTALNDEREHACDDLVVNLTGDNLEYASTLLHLHEYKLSALLPANYLLGGTLKSRVGRLLSDSSSLANHFREGFTTALVLVLGICFILTAGMRQTSLELSTKRAGVSASQDTVEASAIMSTGERSRRPVTSNVAVQNTSAVTDLTGQDKMPDLITNAIENNNEKLFKILLLQTADLDKFNSVGISPLSLAAKNGELNFVAQLLTKGANINFPVNDRNTPLLIAADKGHVDVVKFLITKGASLNARWNGKSALVIAAEEGHMELLKIMTGYFPANEQGLLLVNMAGEGSLAVIKVLLDAGVPATFSNDKGETALSAASREGQTEIVQYLLLRSALKNKAK